MNSQQKELDQQFSLKELIRRSKILTVSEKQKFLSVLPELSEEQYQTLIAFFIDSEKQINDIHEGTEEKRTEIYKTYASEAKIALGKGKKIIREDREKFVTLADQKSAEELLNEK